MKCENCRFFEPTKTYYHAANIGHCRIKLPVIVDTWRAETTVHRGQGCSLGKPRWIWMW